MLDLLLNMLVLLAIIVVGALILFVVVATIYGVLYAVYKLFIEGKGNGGNGQG